MAKALDAPYAAGRRGSAWLKVKAARTLDLVVLAAEWGSGRRQGWLSNLHLGARDPATGGFVMLGKTFKGMTDELLAWQTEQLLAREIGRDEYTSSTSAPSSSSRSPSTICRRARTIPAASRSASRASSAIGPTRPRPTPTRSTRSATSIARPREELRRRPRCTMWARSRTAAHLIESLTE